MRVQATSDTALSGLQFQGSNSSMRVLGDLVEHDSAPPPRVGTTALVLAPSPAATVADQKALIDRATKRLRKSRTEFVLDTMREASENVLLDQRLFCVDPMVFDAFEAALDAPAEPNDGLRRTLATPAPWNR